MRGPKIDFLIAKVLGVIELIALQKFCIILMNIRTGRKPTYTIFIQNLSPQNNIDSGEEDEAIIKALQNNVLSPWDWELFETIRKKEPSSMKLMHHWLYLVTRAFPKCLHMLGCEFISTFR